MRALICLLIIPSTFFAQNFSLTFDEVDVSYERGLGMYIDDESIYCTSGLRCEDLTTNCIELYKFDFEGSLQWQRRFSPFQPLNWENVLVQNDSVFIGGISFVEGAFNTLRQYIISAETGDSLSYFESALPEGRSMAPFGHILYKENILVYGSGGVIEDAWDGPGYIHIMDKRGNYIDHLDYRKDNFNQIYQLQEGVDGFLYFICSSTSFLTDSDDYWLVKYDFDTKETEELHHIPYQSDPPFYGLQSDGFVMNEEIIDDLINLRELYSLRGVSSVGDSLWQTTVRQDSLQQISNYNFGEMTTCANDDVLMSGEYEGDDSIDVGFIMRYSSDGTLVWERHYIAYGEGGRLDGFLSCVRELPTGDIVATGSLQQEAMSGAERDFWILKVGSDGCFNENENDCGLEVIPQFLTYTDEEPAPQIQIKMYPNPSSDRVHLELAESTGFIRYNLLDLKGDLVASFEGSSHSSIDVSAYPSGIYFVEVWENKQLLGVEKLLLVD